MTTDRWTYPDEWCPRCVAQRLDGLSRCPLCHYPDEEEE